MLAPIARETIAHSPDLSNDLFAIHLFAFLYWVRQKDVGAER